MSTTVDSRVVEMRFDNKQFESNVSQTMSTLDKFKQKLNFSGSAKGLEDVGTAAKNVNMNGLGDAVQTVSAKFSSLQVMAVTALANITNSAVNAGKRLVSAITVEPVRSGFSEYEMVLNSVQTTMAATGKTAKEVEEELKKLDDYADKTVYSTADMLNNLPKFTNAGIELETATQAMIGIANATALAGGDASKASIAFYNLGQAMSTGYLTRMDYNSINNAGIATMKWKEQMVEAAIAQGTLTKVGEDAYKAGNKTLTLQQLFIDGLQEQWATTDVMMKVFGDYGDEQTAISKQAYAAAQDIKTFTQMMESLKSTAGTGWKNTWQIIFGDLDQAKNMWTGLTNFISGIIQKFDDIRNSILQSALGRGFSELGKKMKTVLGPALKVTDTIKETVKSVTDLSEIVNKVIRGDFATGIDRFNALTEAGYNYYEVQNKVNEKLGDSFRHSQEKIDAQNKLLGTQKKVTSAEEEQVDVTAKLTDEEKNRLKQLVAMTENQAKSAGLTEDQIEALNELRKTAEKLGIPLGEFIDKMDEIDGRWLLLEGFKNIGKTLVEIFKSIGSAFSEIFGGKDEAANGLFNLIAGFHKLTRGVLDKVIDKADELKRIFKGVFAVFDIIAKITGGVLKIAFKVVTGVLDKFGLSILDVAAWIGDAIVRFRDWFDSIFDTDAIIGKIVDKLHKFILKVKEFIDNVKNSEGFQKFVDYLERVAAAFKEFFGSIGNTKEFKDLMEVFKSSGQAISDWFKGLKDSDNIPRDIILGLINGLKDGIPAVVSAVIDLGIAILRGICECLGIHSPSVKFMEVGKNIIAGLIEGIKKCLPWVTELLKGLFQGILNFVKNFDLGAALTAVIGLGIISTVNKFGDIMGDVTKGLRSMFEGIGEAFQGLGKSLKASALKKKATALMFFAISIGVLAASLFLISKIPAEDLWRSVGALGALVGIVVVLAAALAGFSIAMKKLNIEKTGTKLWELGFVLIGVGASVLMFALAVKMIGAMENGPLEKAGFAIASFVGMMALLIGYAKVNGDAAGQVAKLLLSFAASIFILAGVVGLFALMPITWIVKGLAAIAGLTLIMGGLIYITSMYESKGNKVAAMLLGAATAMTLMAGILWLLAPMKMKNIIKGEAAMLGFVGIIGALLLVTNLANNDLTKVSSVILSVGATMLLMALVMKICGKMTVKQIVKGEAVIASFATLIALLIKTTQKAGKDLGSVAVTLLAAAAAIAILAGVAILLGFIPIENLTKGVAAVTLLGGLVAALMQSTRGLDKCKGSIIAMAVIIGLLTAAVAGLAFIPVEKLESSVVALGTVMGMMALLFLAAGTMKDVKVGPILVMGLVVAALGAILWAMSELEVNVPLETIAGLSILMVAMGGMVALLSLVGSKASKAYQGIFALLLMAAPLLAFVLVLRELNGVTVSPETLISLLATVTLMTLLLPLLALVGTIGLGSALAGVLALTLMAVPLASFALVLAGMQGIQNAAANAAILMTLMTLSAALLIPLLLVGALFYPALMGIVALGAMAVPMASYVGVLALMQNIKGAAENTDLLINLMWELTAMLMVLAPVGPLALIASSALGALVALMTVVGLLIASLGFLKTDGYLKDAMDNVIPLMIQLAGGMGEMIGAFVAGIATQVAAALPGIAESMSLFMTNLQGFIEGAKNVDAKVLAGVAVIVASIIALSVAELFAAISAFLSGGGGLPELGRQLSEFMINALPFVMTAMMITPSMLEGVKALTSAILMLTGANLLESLTSWLTGESSLETFAAQFPILGRGLRGFLDCIGVFSAAEMATVNCAAHAIKTLAEASRDIPNSGGLLGDLVGNNDLGPFAAQFPMLGNGLRKFLDNIGTFSDAEIATVNCAAEAVKTLAESAKEIPNQGGLLADLIGDNTMATFAAQFPLLGTGLRDFLTNVGTFTDAEVATVDCGARAVKLLAEAASEIPNEGGWAAAILGDNTLQTFANQFPYLGLGLVNFLSAFGETGFGEEQLNIVKFGAQAVAEIAKAADTIPNSGGWWGKIAGENNLGSFASQFSTLGEGLAKFVEKIGTFTEAEVATVNAAAHAIGAIANLDDAKIKEKHFDNLPDIAGYIKTFCTSIGTIDERTVRQASSAVRSVKALIEDLQGVETEGAEDFADALKTLGNNSVDAFINAFKDVDANVKMDTAAKSLMNKAIEGIESKTEDFTAACNSVATAGSDALGGAANVGAFNTAGMNLVIGFASGISENTYRAEAKARAMAKAAADAAKAELDINSPSKVFRAIGYSVPEGFAMGIDRMTGMVTASSETMANKAVRSVSASIARIADAVNTDIDSQPTIRPVMDLSDVESGASAIGSMLGLNPSVGVLANVGSISSMMNQRTHSGTNADVVSAIDKLNKKMDNFGNTSYHINGVTYDDGSNISDAVKTIVRAARIERRV